MPARHERLNGLGNLRPHILGGAENHLCGEDRIDLERGEDRLAACGALVRVAPRHALYGEQDGFFPFGEIENLRLERFPPLAVVDVRDDAALDKMGRIPFLKLLVLERNARRLACAHEHMAADNHVKHGVRLRT